MTCPSRPAYQIVSRQTTTSSHGVEWSLTLEAVGHARPAVVVEVEQESWVQVRVGDYVVMTPHVVGDLPAALLARESDEKEGHHVDVNGP